MNSNAAKSLLPQSKFGLGSDHGDMIVMLIKYFRIVAMVFVVWFIGYFNFSIAWILFAAFIFLLREKTNSARLMKSKMIECELVLFFYFSCKAGTDMVIAFDTFRM